MKIRKVINKRLRGEGNLAGGVNAVVAANVNEPEGSVASVRSRQKIVQRNGKTDVFEQTLEDTEEKGEKDGWE